jgi:hypothetical protein
MAVIKQACPKCGQRVSGDESFFGTSVDCPVCSAKIEFPDPEAEAREKEREEDEKDVKKASPPPLDGDGDGDEPVKTHAHTEPIELEPRSSIVSTTYAEPPSATLSIISMVLGILNAVTFCIPAILLAPAAIICGHIALLRGKFSPIQPPPGRSMALAGLILGYLGMVVMLTALGLAVTGVFNVFVWFKGHLLGS